MLHEQMLIESVSIHNDETVSVGRFCETPGIGV
jgi:hypothetical protein